MYQYKPSSRDISSGTKKYDKEMPQSHTADHPRTPWGRDTTY